MTHDDPAIAAAFLERFLRDREAGGERELAAYLADFPGHEDLIGREYAALTEPLVASGAAADQGGEEGPLVAHYRLLGEIGRGGQGTVYRARDERLRRTVALKVLDRLGQHSQELLQRFRREAEVASRLDHRGICTILDSGVADGTAYIAMRFVEGESLDQEISRARREHSDANDSQPLTREAIQRVALLFEKAARATHAAHEAGIVHRDIKPGNIMVTPADEPVLLDFGLARDESGERATLTRTGDVFGTPAYMSPEQLRGEGARLDRRTDVYSLGASLFERLTLRPPHESPTREGLYRAILEYDAPSPSSWNKALPRDLAIVVSTALEKDRDRRYRTALELADDLARFLRFEPIHARPVTRWMRARRWVQRNRTVASLAALLIVVLSVSLGVIWRQNVQLAAELEDARAGRSSKRRQQIRVLVETGYQRLFSANAEGADAIFEELLALDPENKTAWVGRAWSDIFEPEKALAVLDRAPESVRADPDLLWMRGVVLDVGERGAEAQEYYRQAGAGASDLRAYLNGLRTVRGFWARDPELASEALVHFRAAVLMAPAPQFHYFHSVLMAAAYAADQEAMVEAATMLEHHWPDEPATLDAIAQFFAQSDPARARGALERLLELEPSAAPCIGLAMFARQDGDDERAMELYTRGIELEPDFAAAWHSRGDLHAQRGEVELARADYLEALARDHKFYPAALGVAAGHQASGDTAAAVRFLEEYVEQVRDVPLAREPAMAALEQYRASQQP